MTSSIQLTPARSLADYGPISCWDAVSECTLTMADPMAEPELFAAYHRGAVASYARFGVGDALDGDTARCAQDTALFWAMRDIDGVVVGGVRAKGPLRTPDDSHAVVEWAGRPGEDAVRSMIADRLAFGVLEMKAAWITTSGAGDRRRVKQLARSVFHGMAVLDVQFCMATSAAHILEQWKSSGGVIAAIPATPYPDERYQTKMLWWDRRTFRSHGEPDQVAATDQEVAHVHRWARTESDHDRRYAS